MESKKDITEVMNSLFLKEWTEKLEQSNIFDPKDKDQLVTKENVNAIIKALELQEVIQANVAQDLLIYYDKKQVPFNVFYKDLIKEMEAI